MEFYLLWKPDDNLDRYAEILARRLKVAGQLSEYALTKVIQQEEVQDFKLAHIIRGAREGRSTPRGRKAEPGGSDDDPATPEGSRP